MVSNATMRERYELRIYIGYSKMTVLGDHETILSE